MKYQRFIQEMLLHAKDMAEEDVGNEQAMDHVKQTILEFFDISTPDEALDPKLITKIYALAKGSKNKHGALYEIYTLLAPAMEGDNHSS